MDKPLWPVELSVNIDHVATVRNARGGAEPDPVWAAVEAELGGADGITVHLREDRRHIRDRDVRLLKETVQTRFNLEMAAVPEIVDFAIAVKPEMVMLVPERRMEVTTEGGLNVVQHRTALAEPIKKLLNAGLKISMFLDAEPEQIRAARDLGACVCEVHTGPYAQAFARKERSLIEAEQAKVARAGEEIRKAGMQFNAGHGLTVANVAGIAALPGVRELHIGHSIISRAVFLGLREAVREMKKAILQATR